MLFRWIDPETLMLFALAGCTWDWCCRHRIVLPAFSDENVLLRLKCLSDVAPWTVESCDVICEDDCFDSVRFDSLLSVFDDFITDVDSECVMLLTDLL